MPDDSSPDTATSLSGQSFSEAQARQLLEEAKSQAGELMHRFADAFRSEWTHNPATSVRAVLGFWILKAYRHLRAAISLADSYDLTKVADVHYRSMIEIQLQLRLVLQAPDAERERMAKKVSAWGCVDYLEKTEAFKQFRFGEKGHSEMLAHLSNYEPSLIQEIRRDRGKRVVNWFGMSFTRLGATVSRSAEDLATLYQMVSAQAHGSWDMVLDVVHPEPGKLDFRGYPNKAQLFLWGAELIDRVTRLQLSMWNEIAVAVGAPKVEAPEVTGSPFEPLK